MTGHVRTSVSTPPRHSKQKRYTAYRREPFAAFSSRFGNLRRTDSLKLIAMSTFRTDQIEPVKTGSF